MLLLVHILRAFDLLSLVELHLILTSRSSTLRVMVLQVIIVAARVLCALWSLIVYDIKVATLLVAPVLQLDFDFRYAILTSFRC